jgi:hypothetical protein
MARYRNIHGRKPGRGLRPWLLVPKMLCVALALGGLAAAAALANPFGASTPETALQFREVHHHLALIYTRVVIPGTTGAALLGLALLLHTGRIMLRQRWLQVKLALLLLVLPGLHGLSAWRLHVLEARIASPGKLPLAADGGHAETAAALTWVFAMALLGLAALATVAAIGRQKPRFGQNWARAQRSARPVNGGRPGTPKPQGDASSAPP